jgi:hypothetical protein
MSSLYEWKFVSEENVANIPFKICAFITVDTIENVMYLKIRKVSPICFSTILLRSRELCEVIPLGSQIGSGRDTCRGSRSGALANLARKL